MGRSEKECSGRGNSQCKGPEAGPCQVLWTAVENTWLEQKWGQKRNRTKDLHSCYYSQNHLYYLLTSCPSVSPDLIMNP